MSKSNAEMNGFIPLVIVLVAVILMYSAVKDQSPIAVVKSIVTNQSIPTTGPGTDSPDPASGLGPNTTSGSGGGGGGGGSW